MSYVSPVARVLMGKMAGDVVSLGGREIEVIEVA
jgi:transcription elongation GreA/GreB family factor